MLISRTRAARSGPARPGPSGSRAGPASRLRDVFLPNPPLRFCELHDQRRVCGESRQSPSARCRPTRPSRAQNRGRTPSAAAVRGDRSFREQPENTALHAAKHTARG